jgi:hypothetical protein
VFSKSYIGNSLIAINPIEKMEKMFNDEVKLTLFVILSLTAFLSLSIELRQNEFTTTQCVVRISSHTCIGWAHRSIRVQLKKKE